MSRNRPWRRADYVAYFDAFLNGEGEGMSKTKFGYYAAGEMSFIVNLTKGERRMQLHTIERAVDFVESFVKNKAKNANMKKEETQNDDQEHLSA